MSKMWPAVRFILPGPRRRCGRISMPLLHLHWIGSTRNGIGVRHIILILRTALRTIRHLCTVVPFTIPSAGSWIRYLMNTSAEKARMRRISLPFAMAQQLPVRDCPNGERWHWPIRGRRPLAFCVRTIPMILRLLRQILWPTCCLPIRGRLCALAAGGWMCRPSRLIWTGYGEIIRLFPQSQTNRDFLVKAPGRPLPDSRVFLIWQATAL